MLKMRLQRTGRRNDPSFRVVVTESTRGPKSGKHVALLGSYNPKLNQFQIDTDAAKNWISKGVQVSDTVHNLLVSGKVIEGKKVNVLPKKSPIVSETKEEEKASDVAPAQADEKNAVGESAEESAVASEEIKEEVPVETEVKAEETAAKAPAEAADTASEEKKEG